MKKILYANGDSFVFGMEALGDRNKSPENKNFSIPAHLAKILGMEQVINNAYCGSTNEFIFRKTMLDVLRMEKQGIDLTSVFCLIGITTLHRTEVDGDRFFEDCPKDLFEYVQNHPEYPIEYDNFKTLFVNPGHTFGVVTSEKHPVKWRRSFENDVIPWCSQWIWTEAIQMEPQEIRMIALSDFLKNRGIDHIFINCVCPLVRTTTGMIDFSSPNMFKIETEAFYSWAKVEHPAEYREYNHFSSKAYELYAQDELAPYIRKNFDV